MCTSSRTMKVGQTHALHSGKAIRQFYWIISEQKCGFVSAVKIQLEMFLVSLRLHRLDGIEILLTLRKMFAANQSPATLWLGTELYVMLNHPDDVAAVLSSQHCLEKANIYKLVAKRLQTDGLVSSAVPIWRKHRKMIAQGFSESVVTGYMDMFNAHIDRLIADLETHCDGGEFNLKPVANMYFMNTVLDTTLGHDVEEADKHTYEKFFSE